MTADPFNLVVAFLIGWLANSVIVSLIFGAFWLAFLRKEPPAALLPPETPR